MNQAILPPIIEPQMFGRLLLQGAIAAIITFGLFVLMHKLIASDQVSIAPGESIVFEAPIFDRQETPPTIKKALPEPPKPQVRPQTPPPEATEENNEDELPGPEITPPVIENVVALPSFGNNRGAGDARPIVRMEPKYPVTAARDGIEGWVKMRFDISASGQVTNIKIIDAEPKRTFNKAARRALSKWKYQPKIENGKGIVQRNQSVMLSFNLDKQA